MDKQSVEQTIREFCETHEKGKLYKISDLMDWYIRLTGACLDGVENFITMYHKTINEEISVDYFLYAVRGAFRPQIIKRLTQAWRAKE